VVHTEEKVIANGNSVVHFKKVEITPKDLATPAIGDKPKKTFDIPVSSSPVPEATSSKNDIDSEPVDNDGSLNRSKDVEEIDSVSSTGQVRHTTKARNPKKLIFLV